MITWTIPGSIAVWGLAIDDNGNIWSAENDQAILYRFAPGTNQLCTYALPNDSKTVYLHKSEQGIWLGDYITDSMIRLNTTNNQLTYWKIDTKGSNSNPIGMTTDDDGTLWWGDGGLGSIGHLEPAANRFSFYQGPGGRVSSPNYVALDGENVWWADTFVKQFGVLNPSLAISTTYTVTPTTATLSPTCANLGAGNDAAVTVSSQTLAFSNTDVPAPNRLACGWAIQPMPSETAFADIVIASGRVWLSDARRSTLVGTPDHLIEKTRKSGTISQWFSREDMCHFYMVCPLAHWWQRVISRICHRSKNNKRVMPDPVTRKLVSGSAAEPMALQDGRAGDIAQGDRQICLCHWLGDDRRNVKQRQALG